MAYGMPVKDVYSYQSHFGSHAKMVDKEATEKLGDAERVVCKDDFGWYITKVKNLDSGLADPYRNGEEEYRNSVIKESGIGEEYLVKEKPAGKKKK